MYGGIYIVKYMNPGEIFKTHKWRETDKTHGEEWKKIKRQTRTLNTFQKKTKVQACSSLSILLHYCTAITAVCAKRF